MPKDAFLAEMQGLRWVHRWKVEPGIVTPGTNDCDLLVERLGLPEDLTGLSVLDIGASDGSISFMCERRGAKRVVAQDIQIRRTLQSLHRYLDSKVEVLECSVYQLDPATTGQFDIVIFSGILYHMRYPLLAIDRVHGVAKDRVYVESHCAPISMPASTFPAFAFPTLFYEKDEVNGDYSNWFGPASATLMAMFRSAGFSIEQYSQWGDRVAFHARVQPGPRPFLAHDSAAHVSYAGLHDLTPEEELVQRPRRNEKW